MRTLRRRVIELSTVGLLLGGSLAVAGEDVTGEWEITLETDADTMRPHLSLEQEDEDVSGTYRDEFGQVKVSGTVKGHEISLEFKADIPNENLIVTYTGTVTGSTMQGKVKFGDLGEGDFTGRKQ